MTSYWMTINFFNWTIRIHTKVIGFWKLSTKMVTFETKRKAN